MGLLDNLKSASNAAADPNGEPQLNYAPGWRWENPNDGVEGIVVSVDKRVNDNNPEGYPVITLRQANGEDIAIHGFTTVLQRELEERNLRAGDLLAVIYDGKKTAGSGRQFHAFRVAHEPGAGQVPQPAAAPVAAPVADPWSSAPAVRTDDIPPF